MRTFVRETKVKGGVVLITKNSLETVFLETLFDRSAVVDEGAASSTTPLTSLARAHSLLVGRWSVLRRCHPVRGHRDHVEFL